MKTHSLILNWRTRFIFIPLITAFAVIGIESFTPSMGALNVLKQIGLGLTAFAVLWYCQKNLNALAKPYWRAYQLNYAGLIQLGIWSSWLLGWKQEITWSIALILLALINFVYRLLSSDTINIPIPRRFYRITHELLWTPIVFIIAIIGASFWLALGPQPKAIHSLIIFVSTLSVVTPQLLTRLIPNWFSRVLKAITLTGIDIKKVSILWRLMSVDYLLFNKMGVLTQGELTVDTLIPCIGIQKSEILQYCYSLEALATGPHAAAVQQFARQHQVEPLAVKYFQMLQGFGVRGQVDTDWIIVGNRLFMQKNRIDLSSSQKFITEYTERGYTLLFAAKNDQLLGLIVFIDPINQQAIKFIKPLQKILNIGLLTGEHHETAQVLGKHFNLPLVYSEQLPHQKLNIIKKLQQKHKVALFIGEYQDSETIVAADCVLAEKKDELKHLADVILPSKSLEKVSELFFAMRRLRIRIKRIITYVIIYHVIMVPLALGISIIGSRPMFTPEVFGLIMASFVSFCVLITKLKVI